MKSGRQHRVALSKAAVSVLSKLAAVRRSDFVFSGVKAGRPLSERALAMLLLRMKIDATTHGFRSSFRDWCGNETSFPREIAEAALAHAVGDAVERAYRRGDALEKRRALMKSWADYCDGKSNVVALSRTA